MTIQVAGSHSRTDRLSGENNKLHLWISFCIVIGILTKKLSHSLAASVVRAVVKINRVSRQDKIVHSVF